MTTSTQLSEREREILRLIARGATNRQIANELTISINTVKVHVRNIMGKIGSSSRAESTLYAVRAGLIEVTELAPTPPEDPAPSVLPIPDPAETEISATDPNAAESPGAEPGESPLDVGQAASVSGVPASLAASSENKAPVVSGSAANPAAGRRFAGPLSRRAFFEIVGVAAAVALTAIAVRLPRLPGTDQPTGTPGTAGAASPSGQAPSAPLPNARRAGQNVVARELSPLPSGRSGFALAGYSADARRLLYAIGGEVASGAGPSSGQITGDMLRYDIDAAVWVPLTAKPTPVTDVRAAVIGGRIYVPGGRLTDGKIGDVLEVYDPRRDRWSMLARLPAPRSGYALAAVEGKLYLFGGWDGTTFRAEVWQYSPDGDTWRTQTPMPTARAYAAAALVDRSVYVAGGEGAEGVLTVNERYVEADEGSGAAWVTRAPLPRPISRGDASIAAGLVIVVGGASATGQLDIYNAQLDSWFAAGARASSSRDFRAQPVGNDLYVVGGRDAQDVFQTAVTEYHIVNSVFLPVLP